MSRSVAIVCDWLTEGIGGAERVIKAVHDLYPSAPIYTSQYRPRKTAWLGAADVRTGWLNYFPAAVRRLLPILRANYFSHLDLSGYDVVISITGAEAKYVQTGAQTKHICYLHAPTQYYWGKYDQYLADPGFGWLDPLVRLVLKSLIQPLRQADFQYAQRPDVLVANSTFVQREIKRYYQRDSVVIFPPVSVVKITTAKQTGGSAGGKRGTARTRQGLITIGRLANWKRVDLSIEAAKQTGDRLLIVGDGAARRTLQRLAAGAPNIRFRSSVNDPRQVARLLAGSQGFVFTSQEPFGIAPVEALMMGTPVIAYRDGGALDFLVDGVNGVFFTEQSVGSLVAAIERFHQLKFSRSAVRRSAAQFSLPTFRRKIKQLVEGL